MNGITRSARLRVTLSSIFQALQDGLGVSVTPSHFYFPIPTLSSFRGKNWRACRPCDGLDFRLREQMERVYTDMLPYAAEWTFPEAAADPFQFHFNNGFFERVDAEVAWSLVRHRRPKRIIEIGGGNTTLLLTAALRRNAEDGAPGELTSIEPHPAPFLTAALPGLTQLISLPVQQVPLDIFRTLGPGDILFIDSSHVVSIDSDVLWECLRIIPLLAPGVLVHFHDIFTPLDYPEKFVITNFCFWGEQYLIEAFLSFNTSWQVIWSSSAMQQFHPEILRQAFPAWQNSYTRIPESLRVFTPTLDNTNVWPCSLWIQRGD